MKKVFAMVLMVLVMVASLSFAVSAATMDDVIAALEAANVPDVYVTQAESYLNSITLTADQADAIVAHIDAAKDIAGGELKLSELSVTQKNAIVQEISQAAEEMDLTVSYGGGNLTVKDAEGNSVFSVSNDQVVKQTGFDYSIVLIGFAVIAMAGVVGILARRSLRQH